MGVLANLWAKRARRFVLDFAQRAGWRGAGVLALMVLGAFVEGLGLALLIPLLAVLVGAGGEAQQVAERAFSAIGAEGRLERAFILLSGFALLIILRSGVLAVRDRRQATLQVRFVEERRMELINALAGAGWSEVAGLRHARVTHALSTGVVGVSVSATALLRIAAAAVMLAGQWVLALLVAPAMAMAALALMAAGSLALTPVLRSAGALGHLLNERQRGMMHAAGQLLGGLKLAIAQNLQTRFITEFEETTAALTDRQLAFMREQSNLRLAISAASALIGALMVLVGVWLRVEGPVLVAMLLILSRMLGPATQIQQSLQQLAHNLPAYGDLTDLVDDLEAARETDPAPGATPPPPPGPVIFKAVRYRHPDGGGVEGLDLTLAPGEVVGVGGPSGAGKTTFADLLAGLLAPQAGTIIVGGRTLTAAGRRAWRDQIAYVSQETYLFDDTLRGNLAWAAPGASDAELWAALEAVGAADLVRGMDRGLDAELGERGVRLSGGERQRIALARALLRRPRLLILDESASALDLASEAAITRRLLAVRPRPAMVIIAHRPESLAPCERVLTFRDGRLCGEERTAARKVKA